MPRAVVDRSDRVGSWLDVRKWSVYYAGSTKPTVTIDGSKTLIGAAAAATFHAWLQTPQLTDVRLTFRKLKRPAAGSSHRSVIWLRTDKTVIGTTAENHANGYAVQLADSGNAQLQKAVGLSGATARTALGATMTGKWPLNTEMDLIFEAIGTALKVKIWPSAEAEPAGWTLEVTDSGLTTGYVGLSTFRTTTAVGGLEFESVTVTTPTLKVRSAPKVFPRLVGNGFHRYGKVRTSRIDDPGIDSSTPTWLTGTATHDAARPARILTAAGNSTNDLTAPALTASAHEAIWLHARSVILSSDTSVAARLAFNGTASQYVLKQGAADASLILAVEGTGAKQSILIPAWRGNSEAGKRRNLSLLLLPRHKQLIALVEDQVIGWLDLDAAVTEAVTPTVRVQATTATVRDLRYGQREDVTERL